MIYDEKDRALKAYCRQFAMCDECPIDTEMPNHKCGQGYTFGYHAFNSADLNDMFAIAFAGMSDQEVKEMYLDETPDQTEANPDSQTADQTAKADAGKPELSMVPKEIIYSIERVRRFGNQKYGSPDNWRNVSIDRYWEAFLRHTLAAWNNIEAVDQESGLLAIEHCACNLAFILELMKEKRNND